MPMLCEVVRLTESRGKGAWLSLESTCNGIEFGKTQRITPLHIISFLAGFATPARQTPRLQNASPLPCYPNQ